MRIVSLAPVPRDRPPASGDRTWATRARLPASLAIERCSTGIASKDVEQQFPVLSTYLGHACVRDTYWYLSACPELMEERRGASIGDGRRRHEVARNVATLIERYSLSGSCQRNVSANTIASYERLL
jgi:hypothetical protein